MKRNCVLCLLFLFNSILGYTFFIEPYLLQTSRISLPLTEQQAAFNGLKAIHISDIHCTHYGAYERRIVDTINKEKADVIFVTGDLIAYNHDFTPALSFLNALRSRQGIYVVWGNSDYTNMEGYFRALRKEPLQSSVHILRNEALTASYNNEPFLIVGIDDPISECADLTTLPFLNTSIFSVVLVHAYTSLIQKTVVGGDLLLAGHTHGGQITIPFLQNTAEKSATARDAHGLYHEDKRNVHISRGIGMSLLPARFGALPEITVLTFKGKQSLIE